MRGGGHRPVGGAILGGGPQAAPGLGGAPLSPDGSPGAPAFTYTGWYREVVTATQWTDKSGNGIHLSNVSTGPSSGAVLNGQPTWDFNGTTQFFNSGAVNKLNALVTATNWTIFIVAKPRTASSVTASENTSNNMLSDGTAGNFFGLGVATIGGQPKALVGVFDGASDKIATTNITLNTWQIFEFRQSSADGKVYVRVNQAGEAGTVSAGISNIGLQIENGKNYNGTVFFDGLIAEIACVNTELSLANRTIWNVYAKARYGI